MPLIVPLISCFYANQTFLGLAGLGNNTPGRTIYHRQALSWRQLLRPGRCRRPRSPGPGCLAGLLPPAPIPLDPPGAAPWPLSPFHRRGD